ncbi:hypothetical protein ACE7GA_03050 [Roseomonas sp. CCTCC AB2023176]|uniref:hypothetical protein n=1 Tax=Roseomonas sp. CCTCC AB2023176 TaxID=3342640 RepID=UPI0035D53241
MALTALALCTRALLKIGAAPITSLEDGTAEAEVAASLYAGARDALLSCHPWSFATGQMALGRLEAVPLSGFANAFQLPADLLRAVSVAPRAAFRIQEGRLLTDASEATLTYVFRPAEAEWPPSFATALVARLSAEFCMPLTESASRAEALYQLAEAELRGAKLADGQGQTPRAITHFPLLDVRG